ncbi:MAG: hypothetical protein A2158_01620 [Chloroflexi bacterium RBG_13_46_14]|nr:MAG: hypothetical protein A2158_01620 [Chloroflexi bacterium RBG_13_46_14]
MNNVKKSTMPQYEWIEELVQAADQVRIPVFLKDNLDDVFSHWAVKQKPIPNFMIPEWAGKTSGVYRDLRQEFPNV